MDPSFSALTLKAAMIFPNEKSLLRLVSAILMEQDEVWRNVKRYLPAEGD